MISIDAAFDQLDRISGLQFFPSKAPAILELAKALQAVARNESDAERIVSSWLRDNREAPTPFDFYEIARARPAATPSAVERYTNGYDPGAEYAEWAKKNIRRVK